VYNDQTLDAARDRLLRADGALVWVDPIGGGEDRAELDAVLRETSSRGIWVSAHPAHGRPGLPRACRYRCRRGRRSAMEERDLPHSDAAVAAVLFQPARLPGAQPTWELLPELRDRGVRPRGPRMIQAWNRGS
jgi:hypothetical protein